MDARRDRSPDRHLPAGGGPGPRCSASRPPSRRPPGPLTVAGQATPVPPIDVDAPADGVRYRFGDQHVEVDDRLLERLRVVCTKVDTDDASRVDAGRDWWPLAILWATAGTVPARPAVVARPTDATEVSGLLALCNEARVPVTPVAGRSGVCGASVPVFGGVSLDLCALRGVGAVDAVSSVVDVGAGTFGVDLEAELRSRHGVTLGHWPQSMELSTVGGWLACRSAGQYSTRYGKIEDMVVGLDVVLADGRVVRTGRSPRAAPRPGALSAPRLWPRNDLPALAPLARRHIVVDTIEIAARWAALLPIYDDAVSRLRSLDGTLAASAHQSHAYSDGACLYFTFAGQGPAPDDLGWAEAYYTQAWRSVMEVTTAHGGAISHHHGVGLNRARFLAPALGGAFETLVDLKTAMDPRGILNPGKLGLPSPFGGAVWP